MGRRADCFMQNKEPYVVDAVQVLKETLGRIRNHQTKKGSNLRKLRLTHLPGAGLAVALKAVSDLKPLGPTTTDPSPT